MTFCDRLLSRVSMFRVLATVLFLADFGATTTAQPPTPVYFEEFVTSRFSKPSNPEWSLEKLCPVSTSRVADRVLREYGSIFSASDAVTLPQSCIQPGEADVLKFQRTLQKKAVIAGELQMTLQSAAADTLQRSIIEAGERGMTISPLDGAIAGGRSYGDTVRLWNSRFFPALEFWIKRGRLLESDRDEIARLDLTKKIEKVLDWEATGIFFSTNRTKSIFASTAPPGTSQHLSLIAFDVAEYWDPEVRLILNRNGWYQTVVDDPPHFTYLGFPETELPARGLRAVPKGGYQFWIPNMSPIAVPN